MPPYDDAGKMFRIIPKFTGLTKMPAPIAMVNAGAATTGGIPWLIMIGSAMTPMAMAAPTPYMLVNSTMTTVLMTMVGDHRPVTGKLGGAANDASRDAGLDQHLGEPRAEYDDDDGACVGDTAALQDFRLDVVDADAGDGGPDDGQQQQHDDRALATDDEHYRDQECAAAESGR